MAEPEVLYCFRSTSFPSAVHMLAQLVSAQSLRVREFLEFQYFRAKRCKLFRWLSTVMLTSDWCKLPVELLELIASQLHFAEDWVRFGAFYCKGWLSVEEYEC